jgi:hypothetical protein
VQSHSFSYFTTALCQRLALSAPPGAVKILTPLEYGSVRLIPLSKRRGSRLHSEKMSGAAVKSFLCAGEEIFSFSRPRGGCAYAFPPAQKKDSAFWAHQSAVLSRNFGTSGQTQWQRIFHSNGQNNRNCGSLGQRFFITCAREIKRRHAHAVALTFLR